MFLAALGVLYGSVQAVKFYAGGLPVRNATQSMHGQWWWVTPSRDTPVYHRGETVRAWITLPAQFHPQSKDQVVNVIKRVVGVPGDRVFWDQDQLVICEKTHCRFQATALPYFPGGMEATPFEFASPIPEHHYLLLGEHPGSMDSRYLGLVSAAAIEGRAKKLSSGAFSFEEAVARLRFHYPETRFIPPGTTYNQLDTAAP